MKLLLVLAVCLGAASSFPGGHQPRNNFQRSFQGGQQGEPLGASEGGPGGQFDRGSSGRYFTNIVDTPTSYGYEATYPAGKARFISYRSAGRSGGGEGGRSSGGRGGLWEGGRRGGEGGQRGEEAFLGRQGHLSPGTATGDW